MALITYYLEFSCPLLFAPGLELLAYYVDWEGGLRFELGGADLKREGEATVGSCRVILGST